MRRQRAQNQADVALRIGHLAILDLVEDIRAQLLETLIINDAVWCRAAGFGEHCIPIQCDFYDHLRRVRRRGHAGRHPCVVEQARHN